jgi:hypothetical protein
MEDNKGNSSSSVSSVDCGKSLLPMTKSASCVESTEQGSSAKIFAKFQQLKQRRESLTQRSTSQRITDMKADILAKLKDQFKNTDEIEALQNDNVDLMQLAEQCQSSRRKRKRKPADDVHIGLDEPCHSSMAGTKCNQKGDSSAAKSTAEEEWLRVRQYININSHLTDDTGGSSAPKCRLEKAINIAVDASEYELAEQMSDRLANREFGCKIAEAIDARRFIEKQHADEELRKAAKKKKLAWGFEHKRRWETKGNM